MPNENAPELERQWRQPPPGMTIVTEGVVQRGDYFYISQLGAWGPVPKIGWGQRIVGSTIARGPIGWNWVDASRIGNKE